MDIIERLVERLWSDMEDSDHFPNATPLLAHYTTLGTAEAIFRGEELWMSHPFLMNDEEELEWGVVQGVRRLTSSEVLAKSFATEMDYRALVSSVQAAMDVDGRTHAVDTYVACFCDHEPGDTDGLLSMWRAYGANGGGVAIVFDTSKLVESEDSPLIIAPVAYRTVAERLAWMDWAIGECAKTVEELGSAATEDDIRRVGYAYFQRLRYYALFTKHAAFIEEREWRVVYFPDRDVEGRYRNLLGYAITPSGIHPKLKLRLGENSIGAPLRLEDVVSAVILGPTAGSFLAANAFRRMLSVVGQPGLADKVVLSSTPYRP